MKRVQSGRISASPSSVVTQERCRETGRVSAGERGVYPYQVDAVGLYVPEEDISCPLWVPVYIWVIWEIPGRKKRMLETISNGVQALPSALEGVCTCGVLSPTKHTDQTQHTQRILAHVMSEWLGGKQICPQAGGQVWSPKAETWGRTLMCLGKSHGHGNGLLVKVLSYLI